MKTKKFAALAALMLSSTLQLNAQAQGALDRTKPPALGTSTKFHLPAVERGTQLVPVDRGTRSGELVRHDRLVVAVQQHKLQAARAGVDDEHAHRAQLEVGAGRSPGQVQSRSSTGSSPVTRVWARWRNRSSTIVWRRCDARSSSPSTRSITSITR